MLQKFLEIENEPNTIEKRLSKEEEYCEIFYESTTIRDEEGRCVVKLSFMTGNPQFRQGNLKEIAAKRFEILEKKFITKPETKRRIP
ncbi:unnamed protein product [Pieris macdunnoughi]|uniref:Uncharacterized protein n=1 Tax=Pieris macdunnoughi TaxID=345717 RepID=A0A821Q2G1_9NEOP|nr:unnamed protein product [Pieris macdunnoughi]